MQYDIELIGLVITDSGSEGSDSSLSASESLSKSLVDSSALAFSSSSTLVHGVTGNSE